MSIPILPQHVAGAKLARAKVILEKPERFREEEIEWAKSTLLDSRDTPVLPRPKILAMVAPEAAAAPEAEKTEEKPIPKSKRRSKT